VQKRPHSKKEYYNFDFEILDKSNNYKKFEKLKK
jgi:hypothetical protein